MRMRDGQARFVHDLVAVEQEVEVDHARAVARAFAGAAEGALDLEQPLEQRARALVRLELRDGVEKARLVGVAPRLGLDRRREPGRPDQLGRAPDRRLAVAEVGAEPDVGEGHGRSTVAETCSTGIPGGRLRTVTRTRPAGKASTSASATAAASDSISCKGWAADTSFTLATTSR